MSIVVCSNKQDSRDFERYGEDQAPYRFRNHLKYGIEIPKNSEVAVESIKINKDGLIKISPFSIFYQYFGINLRTTGPLISPSVSGMSDSVGWCVACSPEMFGKTAPEEVNLGEFATRMTRGMIKGMPHPDLNTTTTFCKIRTGTIDDTTGSGFTGFVFNYDMLAASSFITHTPVADWRTRTGASLEFSTEDNITTISCNGDVPSGPNNNNVCWANKYPLSHMGGEVEFDITDLFSQTGTNLEGVDSDFQLGIVRGLTGNDSEMPYMNRDQDAISRNKQAYDYVISVQQRGAAGNRYLKLGQLVVDEGVAASDRLPLHMNEIFYYKDDNRADSYNGGGAWRRSVDGATGYIITDNDAYNMSTNVQRFDKFRIVVDNERVIFEAWTTQGGKVQANNPTPAPASTWITISSYHNVGAHGAHVHNIPKPSGITTWNMYPKLLLTKNNTSVAVSQKSRDTGSVQNSPDKDWYIRMTTAGEGRNTLEVDSRYMYLTEQDSTKQIYNQMNYTALSGVLQNYVPIMVVGNGAPQYTPTADASLSSILGFNSHSIIDDSYAFSFDGITTIYLNDTQPDLLDYGSMFVRLDNFTQKSYNAGTGRPSKILYHMPRFDTSNRDIGSALYFQPHQRSYIKFNNPDTLTLNELNLSFCDNQERLIEDLVGQTIVVLHIRPSMSPLGKM
tara:strand:+ start:6229 stop:8253 length:2025 start_codon:yes stop_codon:yes gene_type:complete